MMWGIDLDEVVFNFVDPYFEFLSKKYDRLIRRSDLIDWSAEKGGLIPEGSGPENLHEFTKMGGFRDLDFMPGAEEGLFKLSVTRPIIFITSRFEDAREDTIYAINKIGYSSTPLIFSTAQDTKGKIIKDLCIEWLIEDNPNYINEVRRTAPKCTTIMMSKIPGAISQASPHIIVGDWYDLHEKRPDLL